MLFDGECGLCDRVVRLLLRLDRRGRLRFASLQGPEGQAYLRAQGLLTRDFSTLVFVRQGLLPSHAGREAACPSEAPRGVGAISGPAMPEPDIREEPAYKLRTAGVAAALRTCGGAGWILGTLLLAVPGFLRDPAYRMVARWRFRIFGPRKECPQLRPEWTKRFID